MFRKSTLTFGTAKARVASRGGKNTTAQLEKAGESIQAAIQYWNKQANWKWLATTANVTVTSANVGTLPWNFKDVYQLEGTINGVPRPLDALERRQYRRAVWDRSGTTPVAYDMFLSDANGTFATIPAVSAETTLELAYYRHMTVPCTQSVRVNTYASSAVVDTSSDNFDGVYAGNFIYAPTSAGNANVVAVIRSIDNETQITVSANAAATAEDVIATIGGDDRFLDIPERLERGILAFAIHDFLSNLGAPSERLSYWLHAFETELQAAKDENGPRWEDMDLCIQPASRHSVLLDPVPSNVL